MENYTLVCDENSDYIFDTDGKILAYDNSRKLLKYIPAQVTKEVTDHTYVQTIGEGTDHSPNTGGKDDGIRETSNTDVVEDSGRWTYEGTLMLIHEYKKNESKFKSSSIRNEAVWRAISNTLKENNINFNPTQCENKFKNLKRRFQMKCDNMKCTSSGASVIKFEFYNQMHEIFGKKPNVEPLAIASSSRSNIINDFESDNDVSISETRENQETKVTTAVKTKCSKGKKTKADKFLEEIKNIEMEREEKRKRRHEDRMELQLKAIKAFEDKMDKFIEKL